MFEQREQVQEAKDINVPTVSLALMLRVFMSEESISERTMKKLVSLLKKSKELGFLDGEMPSFSEIKKADEYMHKIPVEKKELVQPATKINTLYYLNPLSVIESVFKNEANVKMAANFSQVSEIHFYGTINQSQNFLDGKRFFRNVDFNFYKERRVNNLFIAVNFFVDAFEINHYRNNVNCYYLSVNVNDDKKIRLPIAIDPIDDSVSSASVFEFLVNSTACILQQGKLLVQYKKDRYVKIFGIIHSFVGDDIGFRDILNFTSPNGNHCSRFYITHKSKFGNIMPFVGTTVKDIIDYKATWRKNTEDVRYMMKIKHFCYLPNFEKPLSELINIYGLSSDFSISPVFKLDSDYCFIFGVCKLHIIRLGFILKTFELSARKLLGTN